MCQDCARGTTTCKDEVSPLTSKPSKTGGTGIILVNYGKSDIPEVTQKDFRLLKSKVIYKQKVYIL